MTPKRLSAKVFFDASTAIEAADLIPVFHSWISRQSVEEMLIDVTDYSHVHEGPALLLVALEADYVLDLTDGKPGIRYIRKRAMPDSLGEAMHLVIKQVTQAASLLASSRLLEVAASFDASRLELSVLDKLNYPVSNQEVFKATFQKVAGELFDAESINIEAVEPDTRRPLRFELQGQQAFLNSLLSRPESTRSPAMLANTDV